jgi:hypothetical protein
VTPGLPESVGVQRGSPVAWSPDGAMVGLAGCGHEIRLLRIVLRQPGAGDEASLVRFEHAAVLRGLTDPVMRIEFLGGDAAPPPLVAGASASGAVVWDTRGAVEVWRHVRLV